MPRIIRIILAAIVFSAATALIFFVATKTSDPLLDSSTHVANRSLPDHPTPELTAEQVVHIQLLSLRHDNGSGQGVARCFAFASPHNQSITGPLPRFATMIQSPPWDLMSRFDQIKVDHVAVDGDLAEIGVILSSGQESAGFLFLLRKQTEAPFADCWMTEGVQPLPHEMLSGMGDVL